MQKIATALPDVWLLQPQKFGDARGFFMETYSRTRLDDLGIATGLDFIQDNHSKSVRGVLRGLHYQIRHPQGKLVRVTAGSVYDVAVDLRRSSPTFGKAAGFELSAENNLLAWIPPGFAHGFLVTSEVAEFQYKVTDIYAPSHERSLLWNDPALGIDWPLNGIVPILSAKDEAGARLADSETFA